jgi:thiol-disulfide isomerase/thioredoxin
MTSLSLMFTLLIAQPAQAEVVLLQLEGMDCVSCEAKVIGALDGLDFLDKTQASTPGRQACSELTGALDTPAIMGAIAALDYTVTAQDLLPACPDVSLSPAPGNWSETEGLDVQIVSTGAALDFSDHLVPDKYTVFDFGADWCGPCHAAEKLLKAYMADHSDVAVRAIVLEGKTPKLSFDHPVVHQHLSSAPGLPYFVVYSPSGKRLYRGVNLPKALSKMDKKR